MFCKLCFILIHIFQLCEKDKSLILFFHTKCLAALQLLWYSGQNNQALFMTYSMGLKRSPRELLIELWLSTVFVLQLVHSVLTFLSERGFIFLFVFVCSFSQALPFSRRVSVAGGMLTLKSFSTFLCWSMMPPKFRETTCIRLMFLRATL